MPKAVLESSAAVLPLTFCDQLENAESGRKVQHIKGSRASKMR